MAEEITLTPEFDEMKAKIEQLEGFIAIQLGINQKILSTIAALTPQTPAEQSAIHMPKLVGIKKPH